MPSMAASSAAVLDLGDVSADGSDDLNDLCFGGEVPMDDVVLFRTCSGFSSQVWRV